MLQLSGLIFDEVIRAASGTKAYFTSTELSMALAVADQVTLQAVADDPKGQGPFAIEIRLETSCDGQHWVHKTPKPLIPLCTLNAKDTTLLPWGMDDGTQPNYSLVRCSIRLLAQSLGSVHLKVWATGRDQGGIALRGRVKKDYHVDSSYEPTFAQQRQRYLDCVKKHGHLACVEWIPSVEDKKS